MAVRQYVGARYVPKFADPVAWQAGTSYEALTIVTYNNASYTSKVPVPATVGNPADNDTYWALTGNYNAQVEAYREEAVAVQENLTQEITDRENANISIKQQRFKNFIVIGDSWAEGRNITDGWTAQLKNIIYNEQWYPSVFGGSGFIATGSGQTDHTYLYLLQQVESQITDPNSIDCIIVGGGLNDMGYTSDNIASAVNTFVTYAHNTYPNAVIYNLVVNCALGGNNFLNLLSGYSANTEPYYQYADIHWVAPCTEYYNNNHCEAAGYLWVAKAIKQVINGLPVSMPAFTVTKTATVTSISNVDVSSENMTVQLTMTVNNGKCKIIAATSIFKTLTTPITVTQSMTIHCTMPEAPRWYYDYNVSFPGQAQFTGTNSSGTTLTITVPAMWRISNTSIDIIVFSETITTLNRVFVDNLRTVYLDRFW